MGVEQLEERDRSDTVELWAVAGLTRPWNDPDDDFDRARTGPTSTVLGIREGDALVATAMAGYDGHRGWVYYVAVDPRRRGSRLGEQIMRAAEEWLRARGAVKVQLMVRSSNGTSVGFYQRLGYRDEDVLVLAKWLSA